ncbi:hypothetical protein LCGC14_2324020, partial [marine sediment metagenome]
MKISELKIIKDVAPSVVRSDSGSSFPIVVHIVDRNGSRDHSLNSMIYDLTRCNRAMRYTWRVDRRYLSDKKLCARCGTPKEFDQVQDDWIENHMKKKDEDHRDVSALES